MSTYAIRVPGDSHFLKNIIMKIENSTPMALCPELMDDVLSGLKHITIRYWYRKIRLGPLSVPDKERSIPIVITEIIHTTMSRLSAEVLATCHYNDLIHAMKVMREYYPNLETSSEVTVIRFKL